MEKINIYSNKNLKYDSKESLEYYEKNYNKICEQSINLKEPLILGDSVHKKCRFCGKSEPEVKFNKEAHVFPRCTGNVYLLSNYECDTCNHFFGNTLESEYSNLFSYIHTMNEVKGRKKIPSIQSNDNKSGLEVLKNPEKDKNLFMIKESIDSKHFNINIEQKEVSYKGPVITVLPIAVYKCLTKMALTIMPENELEDFKSTIDWILKKKHTHLFQNKKHICRYIEFEKKIDLPKGVLYKRKKGKKDGPYMIFSYFYSRIGLTIEVPTNNHKYPYDIRKIKLPHIDDINIYINKAIDLSLCNKIKLVEQSKSYSYGDKKDLTEEAKNALTTNPYAKFIQKEVLKKRSKKTTHD